MMKRRDKGFTLVEVLVAVTLGAGVIAAAYTALTISIDGSRRLDGFVEESSTLANLAETMKRQFANAYYDQSSELAPVFTATPSQQTAGQYGQAPKDTVTFSCAWRATAADSDPQFPYYTITYFIADASDDSPGGLSRRVTPLWPQDTAQEPKDELIAPEVRGLAMAYFDGSSWTNQWDAATNGLPRAVRIDFYVEGERFGRDPWRVQSVTPSPAIPLEEYRAVAWIGAGSTNATGGAGASAPAVEAPSATSR